MKTNKWMLFLLLLVFCQCTEDKKIEQDYGLTILPGACFPEVKDKYVYPIVPGMIEWQQLESIDAAYKLCQLPDSVLKSISTPGLIDALIHAPLFTGWFLLSSSGSVVLSWHWLYDQFNSAGELFKRKDVGEALIAYYKLTCFDCIDTPIGIYGEYERMMGLEILFTRQEIMDKIRHDKKKEAVSILLTKYYQRPEYGNEIFPIVFLMYSDEYEPIMKFAQEYSDSFQNLLRGYLYSDLKIPLIISIANNYINDIK